MKKWLSVDQSLSSCAVTYWVNGEPVDKEIISTVRIETKNKKPNSVVFDRVTDQIAYVSNQIVDKINKFEAVEFAMESPAMGSFGDQKGFLLTLFKDIEDAIIKETNLTASQIFSYTPTQVKSFARNFLDPSEQLVSGKKVKMTKPLMVKAAKVKAPENWLDNLTIAAGVQDYADSFLIGLLHWNKHSK